MWYSARLVFETNSHEDSKEVLREDSIRLINASSIDEAISKANVLGTIEQTEYYNNQNEIVRWRFVQVLDVQDLCEAEISDGMEVYSYLLRKPISSEISGH